MAVGGRFLKREGPEDPTSSDDDCSHKGTGVPRRIVAAMSRMSVGSSEPDLERPGREFACGSPL
jgi:hypothetical protein